MTNLQQEPIKEKLTWRDLPEKFFYIIYDRLKKLHPLEIMVLAVAVLMKIILFNGGIKTMSADVVHAFPIEDWLKLIMSGLFMLLLVMISYLLMKESMELLFHHSRYIVAYKWILPIFTIGIVGFCFAIQTSSTDLVTEGKMKEALQEFISQIDSSTIWQYNEAYNQATAQFDSATSTVAYYTKLRAGGGSGRPVGYLNKNEMRLVEKAETNLASASENKIELLDKKTKEQARIAKSISEKKIELRREQKKQMNKGMAKGGFADGTLILCALFTKVFSIRFKEVEEEAEAVEAEIVYEKLPTSDVDKIELMKELKPLRLDEENGIIFLEYKGVEYAESIKTLTKNGGTYRKRMETAKSDKSWNTNSVNVQFTDYILSTSKIPPEQIKLRFGYEPLNIDYWNNTNENSLKQFSETVSEQSHDSEKQPDTVGNEMF